jgi:hypothetical protein
MLDTLLDRLRDIGLVKSHGRQRTDSTHVLAAVRGRNRLERVGETLRAALNEVAVMAPAWQQALAPAEWYERYAKRVENYALPKTDAARQELARPPSGPTDARRCGRSTRRPASPGWRRSRRCRPCGGSSSMSSGTGRCAGVRSRTCPHPPP